MSLKTIGNIDIIQEDDLFYLFCDYQDPETGEWYSWESEGYNELSGLMRDVYDALYRKKMIWKCTEK